jgi:hypothetical protein
MDDARDRKYWRIRKKTVFIALGVILVITVPIFTWLFGEMHAAGKALDAFSQMLIAKDYDGAYRSASKEFQEVASRQEFIEQQTGLCVKLGPLKEVKRGNTETVFDSKGGFTTIDAVFVFETAERRFSIKMKKIGNIWRLYSYQEL